MEKEWDFGGTPGNEQGEAMEARLWAYIDSLCPDNERAAIEQLISEQAAWQAKYRELLEVHQMISSTQLEEPSMRFTRNVMEEIAKLQIAPAARKYINQKIIWGIAGFFISVIAGFLIYGVSQIDWSTSSGEGTIGGIDFTRVDYSSMFNNNFVNAFMMLNMVLGLMLFDRYLAQRKKEWQAS